MELTGKVAWFAGASSGIGAAAARELASRGGTVAISARRDEQLRQVPGGHMHVMPLDVTDAASVAAAAARVHQEPAAARPVRRLYAAPPSDTT